MHTDLLALHNVLGPGPSPTPTHGIAAFKPAAAAVVQFAHQTSPMQYVFVVAVIIAVVIWVGRALGRER